jgi:hypothetical protein
VTRITRTKKKNRLLFFYDTTAQKTTHPITLSLLCAYSGQFLLKRYLAMTEVARKDTEIAGRDL